ncbi:MAG: glycogen synthase [Blastocatellia bacterium]|jgi:glycosyltransferase involved in cell wall biosynthesis|nr:glycogen synthase [Blastocatellia bacterium]
MRVLFVSNLYPPHYLGGYELGCHEAVQRLKQGGYEVRVLTSTYGVGGRQFDGEVYRWLETDMGQRVQPLGLRALRLLRKEIRNQSAVKRIASEFRPNLIYFWNLRGISISIAFWAQRRNISTCFYVFDQWIETWRQDQWYALWPPAPRRFAVQLASRAARSLLGAFDLLTTDSLDLRHVQFASRFLQRVTLAAGEPVANGDVIHWGIDIDEFPFQNAVAVGQLLFVGQIARHKGVHTCIEALNILINDYGQTNLNLTIVGSGRDHEYNGELQRLVILHGLEKRVRFIGFLPRDQLRKVYRAHGVLLFPSVWDEPFGLGILEAMASGLAVVGTASGGSAEILEHEVTGLAFPKEDAESCATEILRLLTDPQLFERLRRNGRQTVEERFTINRAIDKIEQALLSQLGEEAGAS